MLGLLAPLTSIRGRESPGTAFGISARVYRQASYPTRGSAKSNTESRDVLIRDNPTTTSWKGVLGRRVQPAVRRQVLKRCPRLVLQEVREKLYRDDVGPSAGSAQSQQRAGRRHVFRLDSLATVEPASEPLSRTLRVPAPPSTPAVLARLAIRALQGSLFRVPPLAAACGCTVTWSFGFMPAYIISHMASIRSTVPSLGASASSKYSVPVFALTHARAHQNRC
jgi:hypothetical protein